MNPEQAAIARFVFGGPARARMPAARKRYRLERRLNARGLSFRAWARKTYNVQGCAGKLARIVAGKERS